jgi:hypothetical protein
MKSIHGRRGGPPIQRQDGIAVRPIGDVGDLRRSSFASSILAESVAMMQAKTGARPVAGLLAYVYPDGTMTLLVAANTADEAVAVIGPVYQTLHAIAAPALSLVPPAAPEPRDTDPAPPAPAADPADPDLGPESSD